MSQTERGRLVALKKAKKKLITQKQVAEEIGVTYVGDCRIGRCRRFWTSER